MFKQTFDVVSAFIFNYYYNNNNNFQDRNKGNSKHK